MTKRNGFVALLDVLGFSALISSENSSARLETYQKLLSQAINTDEPSMVEAVAFSDSVVLTTRTDSPEDFLELAIHCAVLQASMLQDRIALRGAISSGPYFREVMGNSVFVAGKPIVDAHNYETRQDWVGIMVTPSVLQRIPDLNERTLITRGLTHPVVRSQFAQRIRWAAAIHAADIPFKDHAKPYKGFAVVPHNGYSARDIYTSVEASRVALDGLKSFAPDPGAQEKLTHAERWLSSIEGEWSRAAEDTEKSA